MALNAVLKTSVVGQARVPSRVKRGRVSSAGQRSSGPGKTPSSGWKALTHARFSHRDWRSGGIARKGIGAAPGGGIDWAGGGCVSAKGNCVVQPDPKTAPQLTRNMRS